jgi:hypothetical protein
MTRRPRSGGAGLPGPGRSSPPLNPPVSIYI